MGRGPKYFALAGVRGRRLVAAGPSHSKVYNINLYTHTLRPGESAKPEHSFSSIIHQSRSSHQAVMTSLTLSLWILANQVLAIYARMLFPYNMNGIRASWLASNTPQNTPEIITA